MLYDGGDVVGGWVGVVDRRVSMGFFGEAVERFEDV